MPDAERMVASVPPGYRYSLVLAGYFKRVLTSQELSLGERLAILEGLDSFAHGNLTSATLAAVAPAGETTVQIIEQALRLDLDAGSEGEASFGVLTRPDVFGNLLRLEPSLGDAIRLMSRS